MKKVGKKLNTISASINISDKIVDKNNFVADDKSIEVEEIVKMDSPVVNDTPVKIKKIIGEKLNTTISASVNDSDK